MKKPLTTEEINRRRDEILDVPETERDPSARWLPAEIPSGTAQALLQEVAAVQRKLEDFLTITQSGPPALLSGLSSVTDPAMRESLLLYIADWYTIRGFHRLLCKGVCAADERRLTAIVGRAMNNGKAEPNCHYCKAFRKLLRSGTLVFQKTEEPTHD